MKKLFLFIATLCCASVLSAAQYDGLKSIESGGKTRQYYLYVPNNLAPNSPLMISCHGMDQDYYYQNGRLLILRGDKIYTVTGQEVR